MSHLKRIVLTLMILKPLAVVFASSLPVEIIAVENAVESSSDGRSWSAANTGDRLDYGDRVRTGEFSRVALRFPSGNVIRLSEFSNMRLAQPSVSSDKKAASTQLKEGALHFFSRYHDTEADVHTPAVNAAIRGTEFEIRVREDQTTELTLFEGHVLLTNDSGSLELATGERARTEMNTAPAKIPMIDASRYIQWYLYYPAILDVDALDLTSEALEESIAAYRRGNLLEALETFPASMPTGEDAAIFKASLVLATGQVDHAQAILKPLESPSAKALIELIDTVKKLPLPPLKAPNGAAQWLARSYTLQSQSDLDGALEAALQSAKEAPKLGYAWARIARLYFGMGKIQEMREALQTAEELSPENAEVHTLKGFALAASGAHQEARENFEQAIDLAPAYADARLGLGLIQFKQREEDAALDSLLAATALEPNRSLLRSYLGKAFAEHHSRRLAWSPGELSEKARDELTLAQQMDPADPTPWLYSAIVHRHATRPIEAIKDLQRSIELNDNRSLFRSKLLLDEDLAVRRSNLAEIYQQAGLPTQALTEAGHAITADHSNFAAHDFIGSAYASRLDSAGLAQRYDTVVSNAYFLRNILAPVGAGLSAQGVSEQEYGSLFHQHGLSGSLSTTQENHGRSKSSLFATYTGNKFGIGLELLQDEWEELYFNDAFDEEGLLLQIKFEPTTKDRFYANILYNKSTQGDIRQITNPDATARAIRDYRIDDDGRTIFTATTDSPLEIDPIFGRDPELQIESRQDPLVFLSYARQWSPEHTTLLLLGNTELRTEISDPLVPMTSVNRSGADPILRTYESSFYSEQEFNLQSGELQHIFRNEENQFIIGARYQKGETTDETVMRAAIVDTILDAPPIPTLVSFFPPTFTFTPLADIVVPDAVDTAGSTSFEEDFKRWSAYAYYTRELEYGISLIGALTYEGLDFADGLLSTPRIDTRREEKLFAPKLGFVWQPKHGWSLRGAWSRSLSGYSIEDQLRLEQTQIAGLATTYRSLIPTTVTGTFAGGTNDVATLNLSGKFGDRTFLTLEAFYGEFSGERPFGLFEETVPFGSFPNDPGEITVGTYNQELAYEEYSILGRLDHLLSDRISVGTSISWQQIHIDETIDAPLASTNPLLDDTESTLLVASLYGSFHLPRGWFLDARYEYWTQENKEIKVALDDASFPIVNLSFGRRLQSGRGEFSINVYNATDAEGTGLNTLNYFNSPADQRIVALQMEIGF